MDWRKQRSAEDDLALVKAAAWAWYQHGSGGSSSRATRESDLFRRGRATVRVVPGPSRYKLEALAATAAKPCSSISLLDVYEVDRITRELDRLIVESKGSAGSGDGRLRRRWSAGDAATTEGRRAAWRASGSWVRHAADICGIGGEVVDGAALSPRRRRRSPKSLAPTQSGD